MVRESDGEKLLYDPASGRAHWLNATAAVIWELLDGDASRAGLAETLVDIFGIEQSDARAGVDAVVNDLAAQGLLGDARTPKTGSDQAILATHDLPTAPRFLVVPPNL